MVRQSSAFGSCQAQLTSNVEAWNEDATKQDPGVTQNPEFRPIKQELIRVDTVTSKFREIEFQEQKVPGLK